MKKLKYKIQAAYKILEEILEALDHVEISYDDFVFEDRRFRKILSVIKENSPVSKSKVFNKSRSVPTKIRREIIKKLIADGVIIETVDKTNSKYPKTNYTYIETDYEK